MSASNGGQTIRLLLFIAPQEASSRAAVKAVNALSLPKTSIQILQAARFPLLLARYKINQLPALVKIGGPACVITGDLRKAHRLMAAISVAVTSSRQRLRKTREIATAIPFFPPSKPTSSFEEFNKKPGM